MKPFDATPLPWKAEGERILDRDDGYTADVYTGGRDSDYILAAEVVRRVNLHDDLVKAASRLMDETTCKCDGKGSACAYHFAHSVLVEATR